MRISGGQLKGRIFSPPADKWPTRPTTDISREALFNILTNWINFEEIIMLDLFGGSGAHSYEFASRGCKRIDYVDKFKPCCSFVQKQSKLLHIEHIINVINADYEYYIKNILITYDYIFAGPPYEMQGLQLIPDKILEGGILSPNGLFVLEHNPDHNFENHPNFMQKRNYGQTIFSFFRS
jgi:16S rRNA (guanine(966)-N(2))-methyltransferase RsmD